jgi:hypothetical protein|tara:strand:- start:550 stop:894 length:345 start_codon:yes stop_codon:yes gene_type:complete
MAKKKSKKKTKRRIKNKKIFPLNLKSLGNRIEDYPFVEIEWLDIEGDAGWSNTKDLNKEKLPLCVSKGYLLSQTKGITRIFSDYIMSKDNPTFDTIGSTTIIPTAVIQSIKKVN